MNWLLEKGKLGNNFHTNKGIFILYKLIRDPCYRYAYKEQAMLKKKTIIYSGRNKTKSCKFYQNLGEMAIKKGKLGNNFNTNV